MHSLTFLAEEAENIPVGNRLLLRILNRKRRGCAQMCLLENPVLWLRLECC
jgi:hypothetical protein